MERRCVVGCMTGTSIDALDAALVVIEGRGLELRAWLTRAVSHPLDDLAPRLREAAEQKHLPASAFARLGLDLAHAHIRAISELAAKDPCNLIAVHGQTIFHAPPLSWQLINPTPIAHHFNLPVVFDLRAADLACAGQGAPITPLADAILLRDMKGTTAVVNLGGFCNVTTGLGDDPSMTGTSRVRGRDVCACNHVLDEIARTCLGRAYDEGGAEALGGTTDPAALDELLSILSAQSASGRSLGTGDEISPWIRRHAGRVSGRDLASTACAALGRAIAEAVRSHQTILLAGGGARNMALVRAIRLAAVPAAVRFADEVGLSGTYREAIAIAVLGALCQDRVPITLPHVTGVGSIPPPIAGTWVLP